jgi:U3 small nucleolar RNA-associated protein 20
VTLRTKSFSISRIIVVLAKDLREEFYGYFPQFFDKLLELLNTKDANQLEWVLVCLAFLFKTLKSFLKKELIVIFNKILPLLADDQPMHITNFAAECFSFVARDVQNKEKFVQNIMKSLSSHPEGTDRLYILYTSNILVYSMYFQVSQDVVDCFSK